MAFTIKYRDIDNQILLQTLARIYHELRLPLPQSYAIKKITDAFNNELRDGSQLFRDKIKDFTKKDEQGNSVGIDESKQAEYQAALDEFLNMEVTIERNKLPIAWLTEAKLTAQELAALEIVIEGTLENA